MNNNKERDLLMDPTNQEVCLNDLILKLSSMTNDVATLEFTVSSKTTLNTHKRELREFQKLFLIYKSRIANEVTQDIVRYLDGLPKAKPRGRTENITEWNAMRKSKKQESENQ